MGVAVDGHGRHQLGVILEAGKYFYQQNEARPAENEKKPKAGAKAKAKTKAKAKPKAAK